MNIDGTNDRDGQDGQGGRGRELVPDAWRELDDTLADGPAPVEVPADARPWLADQRFVHGLLRAMHSPDVAAREGRVAAILAAIDRERVIQGPRRHWLAVAAAALLLACFGVWMALPTATPTAVAAVERAAAELGRDVVRRYSLEIRSDGDNGRPPVQHDFELFTRPGSRFLLRGKFGLGAMQFGEVQLGGDGQETWFTAGNGMIRNAVPMAERERLLQQFGQALDVGYLDVHDMVKRLPGDCELQVVGRETDADGRAVLRIEARGRRAARARVQQAWLLCDEETGMVKRLEIEGDRRVQGPRGMGQGRMTLEYRGEVPNDEIDFRRPW
ncbi:MAG: hypothetical protein ACK501_24135 [Planctomycetota bacterium]|jgi:hypothetical protein